MGRNEREAFREAGSPEANERDAPTRRLGGRFVMSRLLGAVGETVGLAGFRSRWKGFAPHAGDFLAGVTAAGSEERILS